LLVHGAASGPWVFDAWGDTFPELELEAVDLHAGLNIAEASMSNYVKIAERAADWLPRPLGVCGWSMGGLVAMLAVNHARPDWLVLLEPSPPAEVQRVDRTVGPRSGTYAGESAYGTFPAGVRSRPESSLARAERKRGLSVAQLDCPTLVVYGHEFADERGQRQLLGAVVARDRPAALDHWELVLDGRSRGAVAGWLISGRAKAGARREPR